MSDHDPINDLSRFGDDFSTGTGGDMPLSAAAVRRRGDQIRRRRTALVAGASALAVAAVAVPIFAIAGGNPKADNHDDIADDKANSQSLSAEDLLRDADTEYSPNVETPWRTSETFEGDGQALYHPCQKQALSELGATNSFTRTFEFVPQLEPGDVAPPEAPRDRLVEQIAEFRSPAAARSAYDAFAQWVLDCEFPNADRTNVVPDARTVPVPSGTEAVIYDLNWTLEPEAEDPLGESGYINETGLVVQGDRIAVIAVTINGMDYNFLPEEGDTPVYRMIPRAAERLQPGTDQPSAATTTDPPQSNSAVGPAIADDYPLADGWPDADGGEVTLEGPNRTLTPFVLGACGDTLDDMPTPQDQLIAQWSQPEDFRSRQLSTYRNEGEAAAVLDGMVEAYRACPDEEPDQSGFTAHHAVRGADLGDESWMIVTTSTFEGSPAVGLEVLYVVRTGAAVLVITGSNEGGASSDPEGDVTRTAESMVQEARTVIDRLCVFSNDGC